MTRAEVRALLDAGKLYVSHFADLDNRTGFTLFDPNDANCNTDPGGDNPEATIAAICPVPTEEAPGTGQWILMSVDNTTQTAPNAASLGAAGTSVGMALRDVNWNGIGGFPSDNDVKKALFTAATKLGVMELNRPEDVEWNPNYSNGPVLHVAFTKMKEQVALDQNGVLFDPNEHDDLSPTRVENVGSIFTLREESDPATSTTFTFWLSWRGTRGAGPYDAGNPDNLMVDKDGGLWFGTDGNFGLNGTADAVYYLDLDPAHKEGRVPHPTYGKPFRVAAGPSDSEATGPALNSTMTTVFFNVQHPGEGVPDEISTWPQEGRTISVTQ
jgi:secreted PhoX family phosphatase